MCNVSIVIALYELFSARTKIKISKCKNVFMLQVTYCFVNKYEVNTKLSLYDNTNYFLQELKSVCDKI